MRRLLLAALVGLCLSASALAPTPASAQVISTFGPLAGANIWTGTNQFNSGIGIGPVTVSQLSSLTGLSAIVIVSNGIPGTSPCVGGGSGATAAYYNGAWNCLNGTGSGLGTVTSVGFNVNNGTTACGAITLSGTNPITATGTINLAWTGVSGDVLTFNGSNCPQDSSVLLSALETIAAAQAAFSGHGACTNQVVTATNANSAPTCGPVTNADLSNSSLTVTAGTGLTGGGSVALGASTTLGIASTVSAGSCTNCNITYNAEGQVTAAANGSSSGGGNPTLDNCTPDETGNSFYSVISLTQYFYASWEFIPGSASYINCTVYIPTAQSGATISLDIAVNDATAGHTANFQTCDGVINSGTINLASALTCASAQTFTTTSTAYNRVTLTFNVQSTLSNGSILVIKIATATTGTQPAANLLVYPHFIL